MSAKVKTILLGVLASALLLAVPGIHGLLSSYSAGKERVELQARIDSLQLKVDGASAKAELSRRLSDSLGAAAAESEKEMRVMLGRLAPLQGKVAELERYRRELGSKEGINNAEINDVGRFVDSLLLYRDSAISSLPR